MKLRFLLLGLLSLTAVSCSFNEITIPEDNTVYSGDEQFYATIGEQPDADTKVYADEKLRILWNKDDCVSIFNKSTYNRQYRFKGGDGDNSGGMEALPTSGPVTGNELTGIYAVYPYRESTTVSDEGIITTSIPTEQAFKDGSFGIGANTMVSSTDDNKLKFKNVGGYLSFKFYGKDVSVSSITLKTNNGELIAGDCTVDMSGGLPESSLLADRATDAVTLTCDPPIVLPKEKEEAVMAVFVLFPGTMSGGFTITVNTPDGKAFEKSLNREMEIGRSAITRMAALEVIPLPAVYNKASSITAGGTYLIVDADEGRLFKGDTEGYYVTVSPQDYTIVDTDGSLAGYEFTVESNGNDYYLKSNDGRYLFCSYSNSPAGLAYASSQSGVTYPYALSTGNDGAFFFSTTQASNTKEKDQVLYYKADGDFFKIGGSGRTIGVRLYMKDGKAYRGLSFEPESVTCTFGDDPERPALSGTYTTVTYSSSDEDVATVDADGKVTPVAPGMVTITAFAEEDSEYGAGSATYTLRIRNAPIEGWRDLGTVSLENDALRAYLDDATVSYSDIYDPANCNSVMATYVTGSYASINRKDCPKPVTIPLTNAATSSTTITIYGDDELKHMIWSQNATDGARSADVYNLIPGLTYYYTVSEDDVVWEKGYFKTTGRRRMIKVSDIEKSGHANNCRDLGGLEGSFNGEKKTIRYGYIFRGTNMDVTTDSEKGILTGFLNIGMDIDLRKGYAYPTSESGSQNCYQPFTAPQYSVGYIHPEFDSFDELKEKERISSVIAAIFETARSGKASYFHCYIGADRTGYVGFLIEGLLGVSEKDCSIDYELTSFSNAAGKRYRNDTSQTYYYLTREGVIFLKGKGDPDDTLQSKIEYYLMNELGFTREEIDEFKGIVLE